MRLKDRLVVSDEQLANRRKYTPTEMAQLVFWEMAEIGEVHSGRRVVRIGDSLYEHVNGEYVRIRK